MGRVSIVLFLVFALAFGGMYVAVGSAHTVTSAIEVALLVALLITGAFGGIWLLRHALRHKGWTPCTRSRAFPAEAATSAWWVGGTVHCPSPPSDFGGCDGGF